MRNVNLEARVFQGEFFHKLVFFSLGAMSTGWYQVGGKWYYSYASGALAVNTTTPDGYKVNHNGEWV